MHPLRALLFLSVGIAAAVAGAFGYLLHRAGVAEASATLLAVCVFVAFMLPWSGVFTWALRRASDLDTLTDRTRDFEKPIHDREYHGELDDLARAIEEVRVALLRERAWSQEQRATMQQIAASLGEGLLALSPRGRIVLANDRVNEMFGMEGPIVGKSLLEVARSQQLMAGFDEALKGERSTSQTHVGERLIEIRAFPVASSTEVAAVALLIDITQLDRLQKMRSEFLDDFSHEVRTPLAGLRSAVETFEGGDLSTENEQKLRQVMTRQLARIERLVQEISELNRIEAGELVLEPQTVDLYQVIRELVDDLGGPVAVHGEKTPAKVDVSRAQQIFTNLIDNARKHGGGKVDVEVKPEDGWALVRVSDEGEGIPHAELERIFHRFYRVDKSRSVQGTGLGLAITKHLVLLHGGSIRAFNRPDRGATFEVRLPSPVV
ncbi:MAG TPA: ATP-binding protein [Thermoanaerobaculia bacterium]|jgi:two-component system phosphate regulon sensor histidine kinase PhoR